MGKYPALRTYAESRQFNEARYNSWLYSISFFFVDFRAYPTEMVYINVPQNWGTPSNSKGMNRVGTVPFACFLVDLWTGAITQNFIWLWLKQVIIFPVEFHKVRRNVHNSRSLLPANKVYFQKTKFDIKQLKLKKPLKHVWQLTISTSNSTLEVPLLHPWSLVMNIYKK